MTLQLKIQQPTKPFLAAGQIRLELDIRNTGQAAVSAPEAVGPTPFEFLLLTPDGATTLQTYSRRKMELSTSRGLTPRMVQGQVLLSPGQLQLYRADLAELALEPISPGKYLVEAVLRMPGQASIRSNRVAIEIVAARPVVSAQGLDFREAVFRICDFQAGAGGKLALRKWRSDTASFARGRFADIPDATSATEVTDMVMAAQVEDANLGDWQWLAWTTRGQLQAAVIRAVDVKYPSAPIDTGLADMRLLESGFQYANGHGVFVLAGEAPEGTRVRLLKVPADPDLQPTIVNVQLVPPPGSLRANYLLSASAWRADEPATGEPSLAEDHDAADPGSNEDADEDYDDMTLPLTARPEGDAIMLSWLASERGPCRFSVACVNPDDGTVIEPPRLVLDSPRSVLAQASPPVFIDGHAGAFLFLVAPSEKGGAFTCLAVHGQGLSGLATWDLPPLDIPGVGPVDPDHWILAYGGAEHIAAMAVFRDALWFVRRGSGWQTTGLSVAHAISPIRLWHLPQGEYWSTWNDGQLGLQIRRVA